MAMKISNETKVGALTAVAIALLILGVNFLKGKNPLKQSRYLYAKFGSIDALVPANAVTLNGFTIGSVYKIEPADADLKQVLVTIRLEEMVNIPANSVASIKTSLLGQPSLVISKGNAHELLKAGDTIRTEILPGMFGDIASKLEPTQLKLNGALTSVDSVLTRVNNVLDHKAQADLRQTIANLNMVSANLAQTMASVNAMLNAQNGSIAKTAANMEAFSASLAESRGKLPAITDNLEKTTQNLSKLELDKTLGQVNQTVASLEALLHKMNNTDGTVGALMNDKKMYNNLTSTVNSMNLLLQDLRLNPKRYVNVSVFGKKDKSTPLMRPMTEDSVTQEQKKQ